MRFAARIFIFMRHCAIARGARMQQAENGKSARAISRRRVGKSLPKNPNCAKLRGFSTAMDGRSAENAGALFGRPPWMADASGILPVAPLAHPCAAEVPKTQEHFSADRHGRRECRKRRSIFRRSGRAIGKTKPAVSPRRAVDRQGDFETGVAGMRGKSFASTANTRWRGQ